MHLFDRASLADLQGGERLAQPPVFLLRQRGDLVNCLDQITPSRQSSPDYGVAATLLPRLPNLLRRSKSCTNSRAISGARCAYRSVFGEGQSIGNESNATESQAQRLTSS